MSMARKTWCESLNRNFACRNWPSIKQINLTDEGDAGNCFDLFV